MNYQNIPQVEELSEMAACGNTNGLYIVIFTNDGGWIPHFHVFNNQNPKKSTIDVCLKIETPEYFKHDHHVDILNSKQIKQIIDFLNSERKPGITWWEHLIEIWNDNNSNSEIPEDLNMPDYTTLIGNK